MPNKNTILVPVDFNDFSIYAIEQAVAMAKICEYEISLLHVIEDNALIQKFISNQQLDNFKKEIQENLDKLAKEVKTKNKINIGTIIKSGKVYDQIIKTAETISASLIVMGSAGESGSKKKFIGSNSIRVVRESKIPVITIGNKNVRKKIKEIILPLDLSKETREKVGKAIELSKLFNHAIVRVVSVVFTNDEFVVNRLTRQLSQVKSYIEKSDVECSAEIIKGSKSEESLADSIVEYAVKIEGDLIMIMTQQEIESTKYFIGSSAQEIINNSKIPVLSIRPSNKAGGQSLANL
jgi:nucleotide-binding universal stress UspA family protein